MKFRIIATLLVIVATVVLFGLFGSSQEATDVGASSAPQAGEFNMDSINSMRK